MNEHDVNEIAIGTEVKEKKSWKERIIERSGRFSNISENMVGVLI